MSTAERYPDQNWQVRASIVMNAEDYLALIKSLIALCPDVISFSILREDAQGDKGLWRYRLTLKGCDQNLMFY